MLDNWNAFSRTVGDHLLGWLLALPRDLTLIGVASTTALLMLLIRWLTTDQDRLQRIDLDRRQLKQLIREARRAGDHEARARYRETRNQLGLRKLGAELVPLLAALLPVAVLATWALDRLEFYPPAEDEETEVHLYVPRIWLGELVPLVPQTGLHAAAGWIQSTTVREGEVPDLQRLLAQLTFQSQEDPPPDFVATWKISGKAQPTPYSLLFRVRDATVAHEFQVGQRTYAPPLLFQKVEDQEVVVQVKLREYRPFGWISGLGGILPGWLVGYLVLIFPLTWGLKKILGVY